MVPQLKIGNQDKGERLDAILARTYPQYSRVFFQRFMKKGGVTLLGAPREPSYRVRVGEVFQLANFEAFHADPVTRRRTSTRSDVTPKILFEDQSILVIDKPAGLVVHPAPGHRVGTLMDWLKDHLGSSVSKMFTDPERLGLVHRLDKDTSGVLIIAKSILAQTAVSRQFHDRTVQKTYTAFVEGVPTSKTGIINAPVGRDRRAPTRMAISALGRESETAFEIKEALKEVSQLSLHPKTGRTHQIRVHLSAIGHPIVGDRTYGSKSVWVQEFGIQRPLLHAEHLKLAHPDTGEQVTFHAPWPDDFHQAQRSFRQAFKALGILLAVGVLWMGPLRAQEATPRKSTSSEAAAPKKVGPLTSDVRKLKRDVAELEAAVNRLSEALDQANASKRLKDLEQAASELNAKAVNGSTVIEETKTQVLDLTRKLKTQEETLNQLRDLVDRLQRQVIKQQAVESPSGSSPSSGDVPSEPSNTNSQTGGRKPWGSRAP